MSLKWYRFTHPRDRAYGSADKAYGSADNTFVDVITGKEFRCNDATIIKTKGKKVIIDHLLSKYFIDNIGDVVVNDRYMLFFDTDQQRDKIVAALQWILDNDYNDLFITLVGGVNNLYIPGIRE